jgi:hypothetical protein
VQVRSNSKLLALAATAVVALVAAASASALDLSRAHSCDFIGAQQGSLCLLPFPDDYYTVADDSTRTGRRIALRTDAMPANTLGTHIDARPYSLNDGFSPGQAIVVRAPGLDNPGALARTNPVGLARLGAFRAKRAPVVVIDADTGKRWPIWVELDSNASSPEDTAVLIHPAVNFAPKHRYVVAMRDLKTADGATLPAPEGFRIYRDRLASDEPLVNARRAHFESIFKTLAAAKVKRSSLYLAWDFTVASDQNIAERMLQIRDDAFAKLGDRRLDDLKVKGHAPDFTVDAVKEFPACGSDGCQSGEDDLIAREIDGTFSVPCYLEPSCGPGGRFALGPDGLPQQTGGWTANYFCIVPRTGVNSGGAAPGSRPSLYGHGLLGNADETLLAPQRTLAQAHGFVFCGTDEIGFSDADVPNALLILQDLSRFPTLTDRVQQGMLDELFLGRLMIHPNGFVSNSAFHVDPANPSSPPVIDPRRLYYNGNSQGGILGGALTAVAPDFTRASLGVPAMNYSVLLNRSVDFDTYAQIGLYPNYPDELSQPLALSLIQMLWDRSEANGYAHRMTDNPLPNTPAHEVLMDVAFGDHQVTPLQADVEARTVGAAAHKPVVYPGRWPGVRQLWAMPRIRKYPYRGSAIVYWDTGPTRANPAGGDPLGTDPPPILNLPNRAGKDPHGAPRAAAAEQQMVSDFLRPNGASAISDSCHGPCYAGDFAGP